MHAIAIYESLTGNTRRAAELIVADLVAAGHEAVACPTSAIDYQALHEADLVIVGGWTDGFFVVGQRPGRAGRLKKLPTLVGRRAVCFITYALDPGKALEKLIAIVEARGAVVEGGMTIRRDRLEPGAHDFAERVLANVAVS